MEMCLEWLIINQANVPKNNNERTIASKAYEALSPTKEVIANEDWELHVMAIVVTLFYFVGFDNKTVSIYVKKGSPIVVQYNGLDLKPLSIVPTNASYLIAANIMKKNYKRVKELNDLLKIYTMKCYSTIYI